MRRFVVVVLTVGAVVLVGVAGRSSTPRGLAAPSRVLCGVERWSVKTFADGDRWQVDLTRRYRTVRQLNQLVRPPKRPQNGRVPAELSVYRVVATVTATINEDDGDVHLVLEGDDGSTLIAEAPEPACTQGARARTSIQKARLFAQDVAVGEKVVAAGVGFFDFSHNQTGHADNYLELHPLLSLARFKP